MLKSLTIENPKRNNLARKGSASWYQYYAGFSSKFAKSLLESAKLNFNSVIVDSWNGSGTTTETASVLGYKTFGFDLNPVMVIVAKAKMLNRREKPSINPLLAEIIKKTKNKRWRKNPNDLLYLWFAENSISHIRKLESVIQTLLVDVNNYKSLEKRDIANELSDFASFFYTALFRTLRVILKPFLATNPTWVKKAKTDNELIYFDLNFLLKIFQDEISKMVSATDADSYCALTHDQCSLQVASSNKLPLENNSVDFVLSSPPYCTRIDYAVATMPELAILGYSKNSLRELRNNLIGTSTILERTPKISSSWGKTCNDFLAEILSHKSRASDTYYYKNHLQYYDSIYKSLSEIKRTLKSKGNCVLVVQDSYYKEILNDLPKMFIEMGKANGLELNHRVDFSQSRTMAGINPNVKQYRKKFSATESVLCFVNE